jgi:hypothetical protein
VIPAISSATYPLAKPKGLEKLFPGVLKGRVDGIDSGQWQTLTP